jgi:DNA invertase Pin-like site-specific DNA recombinase
MENLSQKALEARREYNRQWRKNNPVKVLKHVSDYWERKAAAITIEQQAKQLRELGLSQRKIAIRLNISLGAVNKYLNQ